MSYLLDTSVFIKAKNLGYAFDVCPGYSSWIESRGAAGHVVSIEQVRDELRPWQDELSTWAEERGSAFFLPTDTPAMGALAKVSRWAVTQQFHPTAVQTFMQSADYYLVGHAMAHGFTVVSEEVPSNEVKRVKIPVACAGLGIPHTNTLGMLRRERVRFVLG